MAHQFLVVISSDSSEYVKEENVGSPVYSNVGSNSSVSLSSWVSSILGPLYHQAESITYC